MPAIEAIPRARVGAWISPARPTMSLTSSKKELPPPAGTPLTCWTWLRAMTRAAAAVKPPMTAWEKKLIRNPNRSRPAASWMTPTIRASSSTRGTYSGDPGGARREQAARVRSEINATGPTAR